MKTPAKILLGCGSLLVLAVIGGAILIFVLVKVAPNSPEYEKAVVDGGEFGKVVDQNGCMTEGYKRTRNKGLRDFNELSVNSGFVDGCLKSARKTPDFCKGVPGHFSDKTQWLATECRAAGIDPNSVSCASTATDKQTYCNWSAGK